jgi:hypothetical protein
MAILERDGKPIEKNNKPVSVDDPANCDCCPSCCKTAGCCYSETSQAEISVGISYDDESGACVCDLLPNSVSGTFDFEECGEWGETIINAGQCNGNRVDISKGASVFLDFNNDIRFSAGASYTVRDDDGNALSTGGWNGSGTGTCMGATIDTFGNATCENGNQMPNISGTVDIINNECCKDENDNCIFGDDSDNDNICDGVSSSVITQSSTSTTDCKGCSRKKKNNNKE